MNSWRVREIEEEIMRLERKLRRCSHDEEHEIKRKIDDLKRELRRLKRREEDEDDEDEDDEDGDDLDGLSSIIGIGLGLALGGHSSGGGFGGFSGFGGGKSGGGGFGGGW